MVFPKQAFLRSKRLFGDNNQSLRLGRFAWMDGAEAMPADSPLAARQLDLANLRIGACGGHYIHRLETRSGAWNLLLWGAGRHARLPRSHLPLLSCPSKDKLQAEL
jgi:hypothetical protein